MVLDIFTASDIANVFFATSLAQKDQDYLVISMTFILNLAIKNHLKTLSRREIWADNRGKRLSVM